MTFAPRACRSPLPSARPGRDLSQIDKIAAVVREFDPDVIQAHQYTPFFYGALGARRAGRRGVIFTEHGRHFPDVVGWKRRWFNRLVLARRASAVTAVCEFTKRRLVEREGIRASRIEVIYNGVDPQRFAHPPREARCVASSASPTTCRSC